MGQCCGTQHNAGVQSTKIDANRRRLSVGVGSGKGGLAALGAALTGGGNADRDQDRSLLVSLSAQSIVEICSKHGKFGANTTLIQSQTDKERHRRQSILCLPLFNLDRIKLICVRCVLFKKSNFQTCELNNP